jgi:hypothetical protein
MGAFISSLIVVVGVLGAFAGIILVGGLIAAVALSHLWAWFAVPTFGLPPLTLAQCYGVVLVTGFLTRQAQHDEDTSKWTKFAWPFVYPFIVLAIGWVTYRLVLAGY